MVDHQSEPWVQRLRDGVVPPLWPFVAGALGLFAVAVGMLVFEARFVDQASLTGRGSIAVLLPLLGAVGCVVAPISAWRDGRRDRRALRHAHGHGRGRPAFHLPVSARGTIAGQDLPDPRIALVTVDRSGLLGWSPVSPDPVVTIPWTRVARIDLATKDHRGRREDYGLWLTLTDGGPFVLEPRSALGRPFSASQPRLDVLRDVLRALRPGSGPGSRGSGSGSAGRRGAPR